MDGPARGLDLGQDEFEQDYGELGGTVTLSIRLAPLDWFGLGGWVGCFRGGWGLVGQKGGTAFV